MNQTPKFSKFLCFQIICFTHAFLFQFLCFLLSSVFGNHGNQRRPTCSGNQRQTTKEKDNVLMMVRHNWHNKARLCFQYVSIWNRKLKSDGVKFEHFPIENTSKQHNSQYTIHLNKLQDRCCKTRDDAKKISSLFFSRARFLLEVCI